MSDPSKSRKATFHALEKCETHGTIAGVMVEADGTTRPVVGRPVKDGQPIMGDHVALTQRGDSNVFDADVTPIASARRGPPKVTSDAYRRGWDRIFGNKETGEA